MSGPSPIIFDLVRHSCLALGPYVIDLARGVFVDRVQEARVERHLRACARCAALLERERAMSAALRRLAQEMEEPVLDARTEHARLATFEAAWVAPPSRLPLRAWPGLAAVTLVLAVGLAGIFASTDRIREVALSRLTAGEPEGNTSQPAVAGFSRTQVRLKADATEVMNPAPVTETPVESRPNQPGIPEEPDSVEAEFVPWPGAESWPQFESGELVRIALPVSVLPSLGLLPPAAEVRVVQADVLVAQDGFARAVRLVP